MDPPSKIEIKNRSHVTLTWDNGPTRLEARALRAACACADCRSEPGIKRTAAVLGGTQPITIDHAELKGAYAISFTFGPDGHSTGIFTWELLRALKRPPPASGGGAPE